MTETAGFDFRAMQAQGNTAGVPELFVLIMTPLPSVPGSVTPPGEPSPLERHYACMHRLMGWRHNEVMAWTPKFGSLIEVLRAATTGKV